MDTLLKLGVILNLLSIFHTVYGTTVGQKCGSASEMKVYMIKNGTFGCFQCDANEYWSHKQCKTCGESFTNTMPNVWSSCKEERLHNNDPRSPMPVSPSTNRITTTKNNKMFGRNENTFVSPEVTENKNAIPALDKESDRADLSGLSKFIKNKTTTPPKSDSTSQKLSTLTPPSGNTEAVTLVVIRTDNAVPIVAVIASFIIVILIGVIIALAVSKCKSNRKENERDLEAEMDIHKYSIVANTNETPVITAL